MIDNAIEVWYNKSANNVEKSKKSNNKSTLSVRRT